MGKIDDLLAEWTGAERAADTTALDRLLAEDSVGMVPPGTLSKRDWLDRRLVASHA